MCLASTGISGTAGAPFGLNFYTLSTDGITAVPPSDRSDANDVAFTPTKAVRYDANNRQDLTALGLQREVCGWQDPGAYSTITADVHTGDTSIPVADTSLYAQSGSHIIINDNLGNQLFSGYYGYLSASTTGSGTQFYYTGRSTTSGAGNLTGIPANNATIGAGAITSTHDSGKRVLLGNYDNGRGGEIHDAMPTWGPTSADNPGNTATYQDYPGNLCFVRTSGGKHGLIFGAGLVDTLDESFGVDYPPDDIAHNWYGGGSSCPHGQLTESASTTTGPGNPSAPYYMLIYDIRDIAAVQDAELSQDDLDPIHAIRIDALTDQIPVPSRGKSIIGMYWDDTSQRLYVCVRNQDDVSVNNSFILPIVHAFGIA